MSIGQDRNDMNGTFVRWYVARSMASDGKIPVLDFVRCKLHASGTTLELGAGSMGGLRFCGGETFAF